GPATNSRSPSSGRSRSSFSVSAWVRRPARCWRCRSSRQPARCTPGWRRSRKPASSSEPERMGALRRAASGATLALAFLTVLPVRPRGDAAALRAAAAWFPAVGAVIGAIAGGVWIAAEPTLGAAVAGVLATIALIVVTGALHQDGLADCADGLGVR